MQYHSPTTDHGPPTTDHRPPTADRLRPDDRPPTTDDRPPTDREATVAPCPRVSASPCLLHGRPTTDDGSATPTDLRGLRDLRGSTAGSAMGGIDRAASQPVLVYLPDGTPVYGSRDTDGAPLFVYAETPTWYASATSCGHLGIALRAGDQTVELELDPATRWLLRDFLAGSTLDLLLDLARIWERTGEWLSETAR